MSTLLETSDQDIAIQNGRLVTISDARAIAQKTENDFRFFFGEWFLDTSDGVPWLSQVFVKNPDIKIVRQLFKAVILSNPSIATVQEVNVVYDSRARTFDYNFVAFSFTGQQIVGSDNGLKVSGAS